MAVERRPVGFPRLSSLPTLTVSGWMVELILFLSTQTNKYSWQSHFSLNSGFAISWFSDLSDIHGADLSVSAMPIGKYVYISRFP